MLIIDDKTVYEIDEECLKKNKVKKECNLPLQSEKEKDNMRKSLNVRGH